MSKAGFISIIGRPNVGKSTLMNRILGSEISIVTPKAQTTRNQISGIYTENDRQIVFLDTPGVHQAKQGGLNEAMVKEAKESLESAHLIWYLVDPASALSHERVVLELLAGVKTPIFLILNKVDQYQQKQKNGDASKGSPLDTLEAELIHALKQQGSKLSKTFRVSALNGYGVPELITKSTDFIPESPFYYPDPDQLSDRPTRFFVAEKIRQQLYRSLGEEVPYSCGVEIDSFEETKTPLRIEATVFVERESQKGIVIGKGGKKIKEIGQNARKEIEDFLGQKIYLGLRVKVLKDWTEDSQMITRLGHFLNR